jgi:hypothetical protein
VDGVILPEVVFCKTNNSLQLPGEGRQKAEGREQRAENRKQRVGTLTWPDLQGKIKNCQNEEERMTESEWITSDTSIFKVQK